MAALLSCRQASHPALELHQLPPSIFLSDKETDLHQIVEKIKCLAQKILEEQGKLACLQEFFNCYNSSGSIRKLVRSDMKELQENLGESKRNILILKQERSLILEEYIYFDDVYNFTRSKEKSDKEKVSQFNHSITQISEIFTAYESHADSLSIELDWTEMGCSCCLMQ